MKQCIGMESDVPCGTEWLTFTLPGILEEEREGLSAAVANRHRGTVMTIRKADGHILGLVPEAVYMDVVLCLD